MSLENIKALTCDTGGTVLDWHSGFTQAFAAVGARHGLDRNWSELARDLRRRSMAAMLNLGRDEPATYNFDDAHRFCLDALLEDEDLGVFDEADRHQISWQAPHQFNAWVDVRPGLEDLRTSFIVASFTILSYRLIIDTAQYNGLTWDAVLSCEGHGTYKLLPESYRRAAGLLQLRPDECLMVACHPYDLDAAAAEGFKTALVWRADEWGADCPDPPARPDPARFDASVDSFTELSALLTP